jgi:hypothetical protein
MKKIIWVCGIIAGLISVSWAVFGDGCLNQNVSYNMRLFFGYASMVLAFSLIFVGVKNYRDNHSGGSISFGKALKISLFITLIASTIYVVIWMIDFYFFLPDFSKSYMDMTRKQMIAEGASAAKIQAKMAELAKEFKDYRNPLINAWTTYKEIVPVGIVVSFIVSLILKSKPKQVTANA